MFNGFLTFKNFFLKQEVHKSIFLHKNEIKTWNKLPIRFISCTKFQFETIFFKTKLKGFFVKEFVFLKKKTKFSFLKLQKKFNQHLIYINFIIRLKLQFSSIKNILKYTKKYGFVKYIFNFNYLHINFKINLFKSLFFKTFLFDSKDYFTFQKIKFNKKKLPKDDLDTWLPYFNFTYTKSLYYKKNRKQYYFQIIILSSHLTNLWKNFLREYLRKYKLVKKLLYWSFLYKKCKFSQSKLIRLLGDKLEKDEKK